MEAYLCRGRFIVNLKYEWLVMMSLGGAVVSFYHVTSWYIRHCADEIVTSMPARLKPA